MNNNEFSLKGKNIVLTGAVGYLGSKYAEGLSKFGANVILADVNLNKAEIMKKMLEEKFSTNPLAIKVDISNKKSVQQMVSKICKKYNFRICWSWRINRHVFLANRTFLVRVCSEENAHKKSTQSSNR